jgi:hypothetical protein
MGLPSLAAQRSSYDWPDRLVRTPAGRAARVSLAQFAASFAITLGELERASGGLPLWGGSGPIGNWNSYCGVDVWLAPHASAADRSADLTALQAIKADH